MDDMKGMMPPGQMMGGAMMGGKCKMRDGGGMMPPGAGDAGKPCPRAGGDAADCACPKAAELSKRVEDLEKRLDMMQMMMKKKMMH